MESSISNRLLGLRSSSYVYVSRSLVNGLHVPLMTVEHQAPRHGTSDENTDGALPFSRRSS